MLLKFGSRPILPCRTLWSFCSSSVQCLLLAITYFAVEISAAATGCSECTFFVETFKHGMKQTEKAHFGGGNTAWESEKLGKYSRSETRLVEILEHTCKKTEEIKPAKEDEHKCQTLVEHHEDAIENWYFHKQASDPDFYSWLCIDSLKACCPPNTFGSDCDQCPGEIERPCFGNGKCDGSGTRSGTGKCKCDRGYQGNLCRKCSSNYFASFQNDTHITCEKCDNSCKGGCKHAGPSGCNECKTGWKMMENAGCEDVDECEIANTLCNLETETCKNTVGSYECQCKEGYKKENNECIIDLSVLEKAGNTSDTVALETSETVDTADQKASDLTEDSDSVDNRRNEDEL